MTFEERVLEKIIASPLIKRKELAAFFGVVERKIQQAVHDLIEAGHGIANERKGYEYVTDPARLAAAAKVYRASAFSQLAIARKLEGGTAREQTRKLLKEYPNLFEGHGARSVEVPTGTRLS